MRAQLAAALRNHPRDGDDVEVNALRRLHSKCQLNAIAATVKTTKDVSRVLEDPKLPGKNDLSRWWPEPTREKLNPLVPFPILRSNRHETHTSPAATVGVPGRGASYSLPTPIAPSMPMASVQTPLPRSASGSMLERSNSGGGGGATAASAGAGDPRSHSRRLTLTVASSGSKSNPRTGNRQRRRPTMSDPSFHMGNPKAVELPRDFAPATDAFEAVIDKGSPTVVHHSLQLEALDRSTRLAHWMDAFAADEEAFASKAVFVEMRLRQALSSSVQLGVPNTFRTAVVCDAFERVAPLTGRYEGVLVLIWKELVRAIFFDYTAELPGSGARVYAERTPFFLEAKRLRELTKQQTKTMRRMKAQRDAEIEAMKGRNELINKTLGAWNRALGSASASSEAEELKKRIEALEQLLSDASSEVARLQEEAYRDPIQKVRNAFTLGFDLSISRAHRPP